jgi:hypothetical protein
MSQLEGNRTKVPDRTKSSVTSVSAHDQIVAKRPQVRAELFKANVPAPNSTSQVPSIHISYASTPEVAKSIESIDTNAPANQRDSTGKRELDQVNGDKSHVSTVDIGDDANESTRPMTNRSCSRPSRTPLAPRFACRASNGRPVSTLPASPPLSSSSSASFASSPSSPSSTVCSLSNAQKMNIRLPGNGECSLGKQPPSNISFESTLAKVNQKPTPTAELSEGNSINCQLHGSSSSPLPNAPPFTTPSDFCDHEQENDSDSTVALDCPSTANHSTDQVLHELFVQSCRPVDSNVDRELIERSKNKRRATLVRQKEIVKNGTSESNSFPPKSDLCSVKASNSIDLQLQHSNLISVLRNQSVDAANASFASNHPVPDKPKFLRSQSDLCGRSLQSGFAVYRRFGAVRQARVTPTLNQSPHISTVDQSILSNQSNCLSNPRQRIAADSSKTTIGAFNAKLPDLAALSADTPTFQPISRSSLVVIKVPQFAALPTSSSSQSNRSMSSAPPQIKRRSLAASMTLNGDAESDRLSPTLVSSHVDRVDSLIVKSKSICINRFVNLCERSPIDCPVRPPATPPKSPEPCSLSLLSLQTKLITNKAAEHREQAINELIDRELGSLSASSMDRPKSRSTCGRSQSVEFGESLASHLNSEFTSMSNLCREEQLSLSSIERILAKSPTPPPSSHAFPSIDEDDRTDDDGHELSQIRGILRQLGQTCRRLHDPTVLCQDSDADHGHTSLTSTDSLAEHRSNDCLLMDTARTCLLVKKRLRGPYGQLLEQEMRKCALLDACAGFGRNAVGGSDGQLRCVGSSHATPEAHMSISANAGLTGSLSDAGSDDLQSGVSRDKSIKARLGSNSCQSSFGCVDRSAPVDRLLSQPRLTSGDRLAQLFGYEAQLKRSASFGETGCWDKSSLIGGSSDPHSSVAANRATALNQQKSLDLNDSDAFDVFGHRRTLSAKRNLVSESFHFCSANHA